VSEILKLNKSVDYTVIVPTMAEPRLIIPCVDSILRNLGESTRLLLVVGSNTDNKEHNEASRYAVSASVEAYNNATSADVTLDWVEFGTPMGWTGAVNGCLHALVNDGDGSADTVVVMNDDVIVTDGWLHKLEAALNSDKMGIFSRKAAMDAQGLPSSHALVPMEEGRPWKIGMVGPVTNNAAGMQTLKLPDVNANPNALFSMQENEMVNRFAAQQESQTIGEVFEADFISGFCVAYKRELINDLIFEDLSGWHFLDPVFGIGGYDDNDVCVRAREAGWKIGIAFDTYIHHYGHQTLDAVAPEMERGLKNAGAYFKKWQKYTQRDQKIVATYRVKLKTFHDYMLLRASIQRSSQLFDGISIIWTGAPSKISTSKDYTADALTKDELKFVQSSLKAFSKGKMQKLTEDWVGLVCGKESNVEVVAGTWDGDFDEREERNKGIELAYTMNPDWVISIDHDEVVEDRVDRAFIERLMKNPNPIVSVYDFSWINHWDSPRLYRTDEPWCWGYDSNMRGFRMWRTSENNRRFIPLGYGEKGLHCGNCPEYGFVSRRVASMRFRHYGYIRAEDRHRKYAWYMEKDPNPDPMLTGNPEGYTHLVNEENMTLSSYREDNGIAYTMLLHKENQANDFHRIVDRLYPVCDYMNVVWTAEGDVPASIMDIAEVYGLTVVMKRFDDDLSEVRNAGLNDVHKNSGPYTRWVMTLDADEYFDDDWRATVNMRRMAECNNSWAWMFRFRNHRANGTHNFSETARMFFLDPRGIMKYHGRVHETIEKSLAVLKEMGIHPQIKYAPFTMDHVGLALDHESLQVKLEQYTKLLVKQIQDDPVSCGAWVSLALQYGNEQDYDKMEKCLVQSVNCAGTAFLPFKEMGVFHLRKARIMFEECLGRLSNAHPMWEYIYGICQTLSEHVQPQVSSGKAALGEPQDYGIDLEELLSESTKMMEMIMHQHAQRNGCDNPIHSIDMENVDGDSPAVV
jgi:GT2 family glycosyltransferase